MKAMQAQDEAKSDGGKRGSLVCRQPRSQGTGPGNEVNLPLDLSIRLCACTHLAQRIFNTEFAFALM